MKMIIFLVVCISSMEMMHQNSIWRMSSFFFTPGLFQKTGRVDFRFFRSTFSDKSTFVGFWIEILH